MPTVIFGMIHNTAARRRLPVPTPEVKSPRPGAAALPEASASMPSQAVTSAASAVSPLTPDVTRKHSSPSDRPNVNATGPDATVLGHIRAMTENAITYPASARRLRLEGVAVLSFVLAPNGNVVKAEVLDNSDNSVLEKKASTSLWELSSDFPSLESTAQLTIPTLITQKRS